MGGQARDKTKFLADAANAASGASTSSAQGKQDDNSPRIRQPEANVPPETVK